MAVNIPRDVQFSTMEPSQISKVFCGEKPSDTGLNIIFEIFLKETNPAKRGVIFSKLENHGIKGVFLDKAFVLLAGSNLDTFLGMAKTNQLTIDRILGMLTQNFKG